LRIGANWGRISLLPLLLCAAAAASCTGDGSGLRQGLMEGEQARDFQLPSLDGGTVSLSDFRAQVVVLNFWATWCPPCQKELPDLEATYEAYKERGLVVLGIAVQESAGLVGPYVEGIGLTYRVGLDEQGRLMKRFRIPGLPTTIVVDRQGIIRARHVGAVTREMLDKDLKPLLGVPPVTRKLEDMLSLAGSD